MTNLLTGFVGTYTKAESQGVYKFTLDLAEEKISELTLAAKLDNPTYLTLSNDNNYLYAVSKEGEEGGITAFSIDPETSALTKLNSLGQVGSAPCHVSVNGDGSTVVTANYHTKQIISYLTHSDGSLKQEVTVAEHEGSGPHERQEKPHMHFAGFTPDERFVIAIDLGSDEITTYELETGKLIKRHVFKAPAGSGPRHIAFAPNGAYAYVMTELSSEVLTLAYNAQTGEFNQLQAIKAIPSDHVTVNDGSAIHITKDGKFVYVANRGHNSITTFKIDQDSHQLELIGWTSSEGDWPRDFVLTPDDQFLIVSNQKSNSLALFQRDLETGALTLKQSEVFAPEVVCVKLFNV